MGQKCSYIIRYWLRQLWRVRSPMICICKLETHESQWCSLKPRQPESHGVDSSPSLMPENQEH